MYFSDRDLLGALVVPIVVVVLIGVGIGWLLFA